MTIFRSRTCGALASAAALSLAATPAMARDWHHRHDDGIGAGDVFAGLLIVGGIAAIAAAASNKSKKDRQAREDQRYRDDYRNEDYRAEDYREAPSADYGDSRGAPPAQTYGETRRDAPQPGYAGDRAGDQSIDYGNVGREDTARDGPAADRSAYGVDAAVDACVGEVERGNRNVENIDGVNREGPGWRVGGRVAGGYGFSCVGRRQGSREERRGALILAYPAIGGYRQRPSDRCAPECEAG